MASTNASVPATIPSPAASTPRPISLYPVPVDSTTASVAATIPSPAASAPRPISAYPVPVDSTTASVAATIPSPAASAPRPISLYPVERGSATYLSHTPAPQLSAPSTFASTYSLAASIPASAASLS